MKLVQLIAEAAALTLEERFELAAYLIYLDEQCEVEYPSAINQHTLPSANDR